MNTKHLKAYAPQARRQFMDAVAKRAAHFGIYQNEIAPVTFTGSVAMIEGKAFTKQQGEQRKRLEKQVTEKGFDLFIREMAYTWFNRLAALRYMEIHGYLEHGFRVLSHPKSKEALPEILDHAADVANLLGLNKAQIVELQLAGDKQEVLYRELLLGQCHHLHSIMPFLFEAIDDATELLLPDNLTKTDSILKGLISDIPEEDWQQIEVIGWLYQFYISEYKDTVMGKVVKSEDIPAATQLFTPNWIVKYLVQNSVGRQWLATYPDSTLKSKMEYYIEPAEQTDEVLAQLKAITPVSIDPESIKVLDPAAGSGHILVEVYELLREIYLERGYLLREIPTLILTKNIYGLDIDDRAAQLAGFALLMKAREDDKRIFKRILDGDVKLNVYALKSTANWDSTVIWQALNLDGKAKQGSSGDMFAEDSSFEQLTGDLARYFELLQNLIVSFEQAKTLGSLIHIDSQYLSTLERFRAKLLQKTKDSDPAAVTAAELLLPVLNQAIVLAQKYDAVIANPPYMGNKGMNGELKNFAKKNFPNSKSDLFAIFMERAFQLLDDVGTNAQVNMQSWMFLTSFESLREELLVTRTIVSMCHLGAGAFGQISGEVVQTVAWIMNKKHTAAFKPTFLRLIEGNEDTKKASLSAKKNLFCDIQQKDFRAVPGSPIAYWLNDTYRALFGENKKLGDISKLREGMTTSNNELFLRAWFEVSSLKIRKGIATREESVESGGKWFPYNKGGGARNWYGNNEFVVNWENDGQEVCQYNAEIHGSASRQIRNMSMYFKPSLTWSAISSSGFTIRKCEHGFIFDSKGPSIFIDGDDIDYVHGLLASVVSDYILSGMKATLDYRIAQVSSIPVPQLGAEKKKIITRLARKLQCMAKEDWDSSELSWDFSRPDLLKDVSHKLIAISFEKMVAESHEFVELFKLHQEELNAHVIDGYQLTKELENNVNIQDIVLLRNVKNRYSSSENAVLNSQSDSIADLISYYLGCAFGRYTTDREGLIYAHSSNEGFKNLLAEGVYQTFPADNDGIIPLASQEWLFEDDATARFQEFVKSIWGAEHLHENLEFVAESLCLNAIKPLSIKKTVTESPIETIRRYFSTQFFTDHCKMYKKRPIYWLFSSGKEKAFECLVYLHRYNEATLSRMRTEYVTPLMGKYNHQLARKIEEVTEASVTEQRRLEAEIKDLEKKQLELRKFDEELKHFAEMRITLDLDDGVKENYGKFGNLLANVKDIHGKAVK